MKYLVMECHPGYAVVLDEAGRFLKVANLRYEVGQEVSEVFQARETRRKTVSHRRRMSTLLAAAACVVLMVMGVWQFALSPYGTVRMQINPDVVMTVNRMDYAIALEGLNEDGKALIEGVSILGKKVDVLTDELADRAVTMGYLAEGGRISLTVESEHEQWRTATEDMLVLELEVHLRHGVTIAVVNRNADSQTDDPQTTVPQQPNTQQSQSQSPQPPQQQETPSPVIEIPIDPDDDDDLDDDLDDRDDDRGGQTWMPPVADDNVFDDQIDDDFDDQDDNWTGNTDYNRSDDDDNDDNGGWSDGEDDFYD